jgi:hypothetical protein
VAVEPPLVLVAARLLLEQGVRLRALVHSDDARAEALKASGAEIAVGDVLVPRAMASAEFTDLTARASKPGRRIDRRFAGAAR